MPGCSLYPTFANNSTVFTVPPKSCKIPAPGDPPPSGSRRDSAQSSPHGLLARGNHQHGGSNQPRGVHGHKEFQGLPASIPRGFGVLQRQFQHPLAGARRGNLNIASPRRQRDGIIPGSSHSKIRVAGRVIHQCISKMPRNTNGRWQAEIQHVAGEKKLVGISGEAAGRIQARELLLGAIPARGQKQRGSVKETASSVSTESAGATPTVGRTPGGPGFDACVRGMRKRNAAKTTTASPAAEASAQTPFWLRGFAPMASGGRSAPAEPAVGSSAPR